MTAFGAIRAFSEADGAGREALRESHAAAVRDSSVYLGMTA